MDRRRFLKTAGVAAGAVVVPTLPALADHVSEPLFPVEFVRTDVYPYPTFADRLIAKDGSEDVDWDKIRIEPRVKHQNVADKKAGNPSEHFEVRLQVSTVTNERRMFLDLQWDAAWKHQNIPPHKPRGGSWEAAQTNSYNLGKHLGLWHIRTVVKGMESDNEFEDIILFRRV